MSLYLDIGHTIYCPCGKHTSNYNTDVIHLTEQAYFIFHPILMHFFFSQNVQQRKLPVLFFGKGDKIPNFTYLDGIQNLYFATNFGAVFFFELIVFRPYDGMSTDFLYLFIINQKRFKKKKTFSKF